MIHEIAHMWFGNLVTAKFWDDVWLNEAFTVYVTALAISPLSVSDRDTESSLQGLALTTVDYIATQGIMTGALSSHARYGTVTDLLGDSARCVVLMMMMMMMMVVVVMMMMTTMMMVMMKMD